MYVYFQRQPPGSSSAPSDWRLRLKVTGLLNLHLCCYKPSDYSSLHRGVAQNPVWALTRLQLCGFRLRCHLRQTWTAAPTPQYQPMTASSNLEPCLWLRQIFKMRIRPGFWVLDEQDSNQDMALLRCSGGDHTHRCHNRRTQTKETVKCFITLA